MSTSPTNGITTTPTMTATVDATTRAPSPAAAQERRPARRFPGDMLTQMQAEMDRMLGERWPFGSLLRGLTEPAGSWMPRTDVFEQNGDIVVKAELPGIAKEDVEVTLDGGDLVIRGERRSEETVDERAYYRMERSYGAFYRRLPLPAGVNRDQITASCADGILEVRVPKPATPATVEAKIPVT